MTEEYNLLDRVKQLAKEQGKTLSDIEKEAKLGTRSIYSWKNIAPNTKNLETVATVLNTSTDYLLGRTDDPTPIDVYFRIDMKNVPEEKREDFKKELTLLRDFAFKRLQEEEKKLDNQEKDN
ncbi:MULTISPECIES: helix-turn-helix domain-containing protein [Leuconostoc]|uniref:Rep protein n=1 Tax=Leuconostoc citreum (strain KM20) TaxID=349519 RepID=B1N0L9_LEUCK|nr:MULTISPECIES: helix-turn-helix transcriptional regulator [Leuconostoc]ACA83624.1 Rep protein [Leuconostoc citreum KM20]KAA8373442.1 helix-turn-helix transcriptional regulator [Leuconostoc carnosum]KAA8377498.1 helix-turn-helix transcriptional regulator [Leuconostoc carnosum]MCS8584554.1 XRE family transcriptional regulator [Leuconostoc citreum]MCS8601965.1 XRE family transcriptional regulator [Leuconostoc citreum]